MEGCFVMISHDHPKDGRLPMMPPAKWGHHANLPTHELGRVNHAGARRLEIRFGSRLGGAASRRKRNEIGLRPVVGHQTKA